MKDGMIVGFTDMIEAAKKADASAFVDDQQQQLEGGKARFAAPGGAGGGVGGGGKQDLSKMSMAEYIAARKNK